MSPNQQSSFLDTFETARPPTPLFCHQEFLEKLAEHGKDPIGRRTAFLLQRLSVDARRLHYKATSGVNRGWRRSRLGGNHGSHFYAWWAPQNALPLKESGEFSDVPDGAVFLRDIRHHDDHSLLTPQSFNNCYLPVTVRDLRREEYAPVPWTQPQVRFASARQPVRLLKGHPGSGKTTALWHAADSVGAERVLYITYSRDLAALAREYFDRFCSSHKHFQVITFADLVRQVLGEDLPVSSESEARQRFGRDLAPFSRTLGAWASNQWALYDELYAHLIGDALPITVGRFTAGKGGRVADQVYKERRARHLGQMAVTAALDAAARLERLEESSFAERYCPELALAWRAVEHLRLLGQESRPANPTPIIFDCLALDECQDLTPIEALLIVQLASLNNRGRRSPVPLLLAGDEAQTVRPTDFEWAWLSDLLHHQLGTLSEFKLSANLRSPRRIAELVNRVWDLYSHIQKQERPSGTGYAEIDEDATDQILYCSAVPNPELSELLQALSTREGLALINLEDSIPEYVPEEARKAVLTTSEAKGLDFHSVCVLNAGRFIERVLREEARVRADSEVDALRKRLAIDQLRVALSRPTERLIWLDVNPTDTTIRQSLAFLNGTQLDNGVASSVPAALLKMLEEEELDGEERVLRCQEDARQFLEVKPEVAWSRAQQAITLLGRPGSLGAVTDQAARDAAYLTLAEVCFTLGYRNVRLSSELGRPDLFAEAQRAATNARRYELATLLHTIGRIQRSSFDDHLHALVDLANFLPQSRKEIEPWLQIYLTSKTKTWTEELESALLNGHNASILLKLLPPFYEVLDIPDRQARTQRLAQRSLQLLMKDKQFSPALALLRTLPDHQPKLEAICYEGLGDFRNAAECHLLGGNLKEALQCYRSVPDLESALKLVGRIGEHPAAESLEWVSKLQQLVAERPDKFTKVILPSEKKILQDLLERALGVNRRKPVPRKKAAAKKASAPKKKTVKKTALPKIS
ncbi:MAG: hypothetical protein JO185_22815 [Acidobacteriaceae bacterium]|nr:hypothetical protein [Acidobacteriaceae bacterium]